MLLGAAAWAIALAVNRSLRRVEGPSMLPSLWPGELLVTVPPRLAGGIHQHDVVVVDSTTGTMIKRVAGLPGDAVRMVEGHCHVGGRWYRHPTWDPGDHRIDPGTDDVVLLGDNLGASTDSRAFGPVPLERVRRVALIRLRPWSWLRRGHGVTPLDGPWRRPTVRVVTLDPTDRVLLFRVQDTDGSGQTWWETPGGGIDPGEEPIATGVRELREELGHADVPVVSLNRVVERSTSAAATSFVKVEHLLAARLPDDRVLTDGWTDAERRDILDWRWWSVAELATTAERTIPDGLPDLVAVARAALDGLTDATAASDHEAPRPA
jgi:signal peptidase I